MQIRTLQERIELNRRNIDSQQGSLQIADARYRAQQTNKLDVIQGQDNIDTTESAIPDLEAQLRIANNRLCVVLGIPPRDLVSELPIALIPNVANAVQVGFPADLLLVAPISGAANV